mmetsp:Transcript_49153/g.100332  ORF Transcript_49153/g.100332 Transcript_49153/m.100332 type:complete len:97 (-) Transcript_49153:345-635(-)|eukprot:CAMPEP_0181298720 /NCGR_PEP_ID=MMETSP1101-20121128/5937_1 /TAXON_ID=46948 /ORGANISM="Rhodomonas abbreviata, Strain Caron Lab Isolate" /LENGTH=96 /DNA_ID=CAMNT_0023403769 /DNA_START=100 /DNA_END=390 /DNA_ORIENTATION=-
MGGGEHPPHPKWVWSPTGGWQWQDMWAPGMQGATNKNWKRNVGLAFGAAAIGAYFVFKKCVEIEERPMAPYRRIPSVHWWGRQELKEKYAHVGKAE